jgi:regulator of sigma E protease
VLTNILLFVFSIAALIIVHELGHFVVCRWLKVEVEEFGLGFPPRARTLFAWRGTLFSLNWIPLGGFVRPRGENNPAIPGGLAASSPWVRIAVYLAGPAANILAAAALFSLLFYQLGAPILDRVQVLLVSPGSPAAAAGLLPGDELIALVGARPGQEIELTVLRSGSRLVFPVVPLPNEEGVGKIGINIGHPRVPITVGESLAGGGEAVRQQIIAILTLPGRLLAGTASPEEGRLVGYKGMLDMFTNMRELDQATEQTIGGSVNTLGLVASISVSLAILNLLPIPALDGGRILFTLPEIAIRRRLPTDFENLVNLIGFVLLIGLLIYVNLQDFVNPLELP